MPSLSPFIATTKPSLRARSRPPRRPCSCEQQAVAPPLKSRKTRENIEKQTVAPPYSEKQAVAPSLAGPPGSESNEGNENNKNGNEKQIAARLHYQQPAVAPPLHKKGKIRRSLERRHDTDRRSAAQRAAGRRYTPEQRIERRTAIAGRDAEQENAGRSTNAGPTNEALLLLPRRNQDELKEAHSGEEQRSGSRRYICTEDAEPQKSPAAGRTLLMSRATQQEGRARRRRRRGGRRGDTRRAAHRAAYEACAAAMHKTSPPVTSKEAPRVQHNIYINTAPGGVLEFTAEDSIDVLGRVEVDENGITGEITAPNVRTDKGEKFISAGVEAAEQGSIHALAERLKGIRRRAPTDHQWALHKCGLTYKDAARVAIGVQEAIEELCFAAKN